ncbi:hypothetical protein GMLC_24410 [Geomonas limicola]|uniref:GGDEF domain-containing protein n=1 Tax=Geomonas limicola TaxID=2740186 RepID=A0A6V8N8E8_9BACT|nr:EAL domain-containing protein [Geomonas limicola]GFO68862.1 hypothetical protein GMLC_24410 [Geomonas limicola]
MAKGSAEAPDCGSRREEKGFFTERDRPSGAQQTSAGREDLPDARRSLEARQAELERLAAALRDSEAPHREQALERCQERFDQAPVPLFTLTRSGLIGSANLAGARLLGVARSGLIGLPFSVFLTQDTAPVLAAQLRQDFEERHSFSCEVAIRGNGRPTFPARIDAASATSAECSIAVQDLSAYQAHRAQAFSESRYRQLFESAKDGLLILEAERGIISDVNQAAVLLLGHSREELLGRRLYEIGFFSGPGSEQEVLAELDRRGELRYQALPLCTRDGRHLFVDFVGCSYQVEGIRVIQCDLRDVTSRKRAEEALAKSEEQWRTIVHNINEYVYSVRFENGVASSIYHSPKCLEITGYTPEEYYRDPLLWFAMIHDEDRALVNEFLGHILAGKSHPPIRHRIRHKDGSERWLLNNCAVQRLEGEEAGIARLDGFIMDITELKLAEDNIFFLAHHDPLTRLPNRSTLYARIDQVISVAQKANRSMALLFLDIDGFKQINDTLGHDVGDRLLQSVAQRLTECTRPCDIVSRLGGDEFVIVLWDCGVEETTSVAEQIIAGFSLEGSSAVINASIGVSLYPQDGRDYLTLLKNADLAMYQAKKAGGKGFHFYTKRLNELAHERFTIETDLRRALERGEFVLYYQPKVNIVTGEFSGMEALIRWQHPVRGLVAPESFIGIAEESGLLTPISKWIIDSVCRQLKSWRDQGIQASSAINLSASFFQHADFEATIEKALLQTGIPPESLELELTEATIMSDPQQVLGSMAAMKALGLQLSIDDFGIGYSSLSYLKKLPVDKLKIDQSFIRNIAKDTDNMAVVRAVLNIGRSMQLKVIAEGVENASQLAWLQAEGGEEAQGFYFSRPLPAQGMTALLKRGKRAFAASVSTH